METSSNNSSSKTTGSAQEGGEAATIPTSEPHDFAYDPLNEPVNYDRPEFLLDDDRGDEMPITTEFDEDFDNNERETRQTIMRMKKSNLLVQFPQDEFKVEVSKSPIAA